MQNKPISDLSKQEVALYVVATPIGNMDDITLRAIKTLENVDVIACEDTRVTGKLLSKLGIKKKLICYNDHSSEKDRDNIENLLAGGKSVALVSDAGTPLISDPGYKLVRQLSENDFKVVTVPGVSSVTAALSICGLPTDRFLFSGFLPPKKEARKNALGEFKEIKTTLVFFETARRLVESLKDIGEVLKDREISIAREITKKFEEVKRGSSSDLVSYYSDNEPKGEVVIVIEPPVAVDADKDDLESQLKQAMINMSTKDAVALVADNNGVSKKEVYKIALEL